MSIEKFKLNVKSKKYNFVLMLYAALYEFGGPGGYEFLFSYLTKSSYNFVYYHIISLISATSPDIRYNILVTENA